MGGSSGRNMIWISSSSLKAMKELSITYPAVLVKYFGTVIVLFTDSFATGNFLDIFSANIVSRGVLAKLGSAKVNLQIKLYKNRSVLFIPPM